MLLLDMAPKVDAPHTSPGITRQKSYFSANRQNCTLIELSEDAAIRYESKLLLACVAQRAPKQHPL